MSRIGNVPIEIPENVQATKDGCRVTVKGPLGELFVDVPDHIKVDVKNNEIVVTRQRDDKKSKALHGLVRSLIANTVIGVTKGWIKELEMVGVGYRASLKGKDLEIMVGFSHPVTVVPPEGIEFEAKKNSIIVKGIDKQLVGQIAANIRKIRKPEPYKGKGIRYKGEYVRKKAGKAAKAIGGGPGT